MLHACLTDKVDLYHVWRKDRTKCKMPGISLWQNHDHKPLFIKQKPENLSKNTTL